MHAKGVMRPDLVVSSEPYGDGDLGLFGGEEPLGIEGFATKGSVEALFVSDFPGTAGIDLHRMDADHCKAGDCKAIYREGRLSQSRSCAAMSSGPSPIGLVPMAPSMGNSDPMNSGFPCIITSRCTP